MPDNQLSTALTKQVGNESQLAGNLTIKNISKSITLDVEYDSTAVDFYGNTKACFAVSGKINRKEFGLTWRGITEAGATVVGDEVKLSINGQFAKQAAEIAA